MGVYVVRKENAEPEEDPEDVGVLIEGVEALVGLPSISCGCAMLFGLIYALNLSYPQEWKCTFEFFQKILMNLDGKKLSPKVQSLKIKMLQWSICCSHASQVLCVDRLFLDFFWWEEILDTFALLLLHVKVYMVLDIVWHRKPKAAFLIPMLLFVKCNTNSWMNICDNTFLKHLSVYFQGTVFLKLILLLAHFLSWKKKRIQQSLILDCFHFIWSKHNFWGNCKQNLFSDCSHFSFMFHVLSRCIVCFWRLICVKNIIVDKVDAKILFIAFWNRFKL